MWLLIPILMGLLLTYFPPEIVAALIGGAIAVWLVLLFPEYAILGTVVLVSSIVFEENLPLISVPGIGSLHITDIVLLVLLVRLIYLSLADPNFKFSISPLSRPLILFMLVVASATVYSVEFCKLDFNQVLREARGFSYYMLFLVITGLFRKEKQIKLLIKGLYLIALFVAIAMIAQAILGDSILLIPGRVETAGTFGSDYGTLRILPPGQTLIYVLFTTTLCMIVLTIKRQILCHVILILLGAGVMLTYNRVYWVSIMISMGALMIVGTKSVRKRLAFFVVVFVTLLCTTSGVFSLLGGVYAKSAAAIYERFASVFAGRQLTESSPIEDRVIENEYAMETIKSNFVFGSGLHSYYRPNIYGDRDELNYYVHNAYLWFMKDVGAVGLAVFMWFFVGYISRGIRNINKVNDDSMRATLAGFALSGLGIVPMAIVNPIYMQWFSIVCIGIMSGVSESIIYLASSHSPGQTDKEL
jgi:hypothetical protein